MNNQDYEYAGFWIRFGAWLIDTLLLIIITLPFIIITSPLVYGDLIWGNTAIILGPADFLSSILPFIITVLFWFYKSATPGKMALNLKIVNAADGSKLSVRQSIGRYLAYIPAMLVFFIGFIWVAFDEKKQGWHDKLAKTVVIRKIPQKKVAFKI